MCAQVREIIGCIYIAIYGLHRLLLHSIDTSQSDGGELRTCLTQSDSGLNCTVRPVDDYVTMTMSPGGQLTYQSAYQTSSDGPLQSERFLHHAITRDFPGMSHSCNRSICMASWKTQFQIRAASHAASPRQHSSSYHQSPKSHQDTHTRVSAFQVRPG